MTAPHASTVSLGLLAQPTRFLFFTGKGGVGKTSLSTATPAASVFGFRPPPGATVKQGDQPTTTPQAHMKGASGKQQGSMPTIVGRGWTTVLVSHVPGDVATAAGDKATGGAAGLGGLLGHLPTVTGSWGSGHLLRSSLFSAVLTDDGRVAIGAVPPQLLYDALGRR